MTRCDGTARILGPGGLSALRAFAGRETLYAFDLDGTLAPIVPDPASIRIPDAVRERMASLCRAAKVVILTGRAVEDARPRLGFEPNAIVGNHGAEGLPGREAEEASFAAACRAWEGQLAALLPDACREGILVENKGATMSLHYRAAPDPAAARASILRAAPLLRPRPRVLAGKFVENLVPEGAPLKGDALREAMRATGAVRALFAGDDETDEAVFRLRDPRILGIRIGCGEDTAAAWCLEGPEEVCALLDALLEAVIGEGRP